MGLGIPPTLPCQAISPAVPSPLSPAATSPKHVYISHESVKASERIVGASGLAVVVGLVHWNLPGHLLGTGTSTGGGTALGWPLFLLALVWTAYLQRRSQASSDRQLQQGKKGLTLVIPALAYYYFLISVNFTYHFLLRINITIEEAQWIKGLSDRPDNLEFTPGRREQTSQSHPLALHSCIYM